MVIPTHFRTTCGSFVHTIYAFCNIVYSFARYIATCREKMQLISFTDLWPVPHTSQQPADLLYTPPKPFTTFYYHLSTIHFRSKRSLPGLLSPLYNLKEREAHLQSTFSACSSPSRKPNFRRRRGVREPTINFSHLWNQSHLFSFLRVVSSTTSSTSFRGPLLIARRRQKRKPKTTAGHGAFLAFLGLTGAGGAEKVRA